MIHQTSQKLSRKCWIVKKTSHTRHSWRRPAGKDGRHHVTWPLWTMLSKLVGMNSQEMCCSCLERSMPGMIKKCKRFVNKNMIHLGRLQFWRAYQAGKVLKKVIAAKWLKLNIYINQSCETCWHPESVNQSFTSSGLPKTAATAFAVLLIDLHPTNHPPNGGGFVGRTSRDRVAVVKWLCCHFNMNRWRPPTGSSELAFLVS